MFAGYTLFVTGKKTCFASQTAKHSKDPFSVPGKAVMKQVQSNMSATFFRQTPVGGL